jgi:hypothetical protein
MSDQDDDATYVNLDEYVLNTILCEFVSSSH